MTSASSFAVMALTTRIRSGSTLFALKESRCRNKPSGTVLEVYLAAGHDSLKIPL
jgi:hypothetical protein